MANEERLSRREFTNYGECPLYFIGREANDGDKLTGVNHAINQAKSFINTIIEQKKYEKDKNNI